MAYETQKAQYCYVTTGNRAGAATAVLESLKEGGVSLVGFLGFPTKRGKAQLDLVAENLGPIRKIAKKQGWKVSKPKRCFTVRGKDEVGAVAQPLSVLAAKDVNVIAASAVVSGDGRFGMVLWVKKKDYARAAKLLAAK
jgi:predicted amino acid-binding ACT domain protein